MSGHAGTPRFGMNPDIHPDDSAGTDGMGTIQTPVDGPWKETHFEYNPAQVSRPMGTTRGGDPGKDFVRAPHQADYMSNHDGYIAGDMHLMNLDERKVLENTIYSTNCEYATPGEGDQSPDGWAPYQTKGAFD